MESQTKNRKTPAQLDAIARRAFDGVGLSRAETAVRELKDGWFNAAYDLRLADGREVILKIAPPAQAEVMTYERDLMATEVRTLRLVRSNPAIPVPEIFFFDDTLTVCDSAFFFMEKLSGDSYEHVQKGLADEARAAIDREIGGVIREINGFSGSYFGYEGNAELRAPTWKAAFALIMESVLADAARKQVVFDFAYEELRAMLARHADALDEVIAPCLVHWDGWNPNFFVSEGRLAGIIDFERALWAEPLMEAQFRPLAWSGVTDSMRGYGKTSFTPAQMRRCWLYTLHLALVMHVECFYRHYGTDEVLRNSRELIASAMRWLRSN